MKKLSLLPLFVLAMLVAGHAQTKNFIDLPYLEINGYADTLVVPNEIYIRITISEKDSKDKIPIETTETKLVDGLKAMTLDPENDLTTSDLGSNYRYYLFKQKDVIKSKQYILKVKDAVTATKVFMLLEDLEISNTAIDRVDHTERESIKNITRTRAVDNAKQKGITLTKPLNQSIGPAIFIGESETPENALQGRAAGLLIRGFASKAIERKELPRIDFEKIRIATTVNVKFILK